MIKHGETAIIHTDSTVHLIADGAPSLALRAAIAIEWYASRARNHPLAARSRFRRRVWRDDLTLGDRLAHATTLRARAAHLIDASRTARAATDRALADLRDGSTP